MYNFNKSNTCIVHLRLKYEFPMFRNNKEQVNQCLIASQLDFFFIIACWESNDFAGLQYYGKAANKFKFFSDTCNIQTCRRDVFQQSLLFLKHADFSCK